MHGIIETAKYDTVVPGLDGIIAAQTRLSRVDGQAGELVIGGFQVQELAGNATYEETVYLLWYDALPTAAQLAEFKQQLAARRHLPWTITALLREVARQRIPVIDALRMCVSTLSLATKENDHKDNALALVASFPTIVASYWRLLNGEEPVKPREDLGHAANYLYMLFGQEPTPEHVRGLETYINTVVDHGMNASTFAARVIISTQSDMISAVVGAIGALKGPLHGGAPGPALNMVFDIGTVDNAEPYLRAKIERGERLMGFGHRVYKVRDPRGDVLSDAASLMFRDNGGLDLYNLSRHVEQTALKLLEEYKPGRMLKTNVEFYTALLLHGLNLATDLFTPTFAIGRVGGWTGHCFEQLEAGKLIRPKSVYTGPTNRKWVLPEQR